jgi:nitrogen permease regulator 3-like protein
MSLVWEELINTSNLASAIATLYNSIIHNKVAFIDLNNSIEMAFHVKQISQISSLPELGTNPFSDNNIPLLSTAHGFGEREEEADQVLAPKYSILLMDEPDEILKKLPTRPPIRSQNWAKFLTIKPSMTYTHFQTLSNGSFRRFSRDQKLPVSLVLSMARELIDLDMARAIPPLSNRSNYIVSPLAPIHTITTFSREFNSRFPTAPNLSSLLSTLSNGQPKRWDTILLLYALPTEVLPFLIRKGWVIQLRQFFFIRIPRRIKLACIDGVSAEDRRAAEDAAEDSILTDPFRASREEVKWIRKLAEEGGTLGMGRMFERLGKYFDGKSAKEKILRREQVEKSELEAMVEAFKKVGGIIVAEHW